MYRDSHAGVSFVAEALKSRSFIAFVFIVAVTLAASATTNNYYVSSSGSDANNGSQSRPWATVQHAVRSFVLGSTGTTIHVAAGSYGSSEVDVTRGGSAGVRLVIQCDPGIGSAKTAIGQCRFQGRWIVTGNYVDVVGFDIGNNPNLDIAIESACNLMLTGSRVACVTGNSFHVIGNYVHDVGVNIRNPAGVLGCPLAGMVQLNNQHYHTMTDQEAVGNIVVRYGSGYPNTACNTAQGIYLSTSDAIVMNNIVGDIPVGGIASSGGCRNVISNNTIFNVKFGIGLGSVRDCGSLPAGNNTIANNYVSANAYAVSNGNGYSATDCTSYHPNLYSHNVFSAPHDWRWTPLSCDLKSPSSMFHQSPGSFFVNYQGNGWGNYQLTPTAVGINAGSTQCASGGVAPCVPAVDFDGITRPLDSLYDVGAFEY